MVSFANLNLNSFVISFLFFVDELFSSNDMNKNNQDCEVNVFPVKKAVTSVRNFMDGCSDEEQNKLNELLARAIFATATPLGTITENKHWQIFFKTLRPSFRIPTRHLMSNKLLDEEYNRIEAGIKSKIGEATALGLQCDGWSNRRNEAILNFIITTPKPVFFKSIGTEADRHTGEYMAAKINEVLMEIGPNRFKAIVTDNASAMLKARSIIHEKYSFITTYGCAAHTLNLLIGDISKIKTMASIEGDTKAIIKEINNSHVLSATFRKIQVEKKGKSISLKLPCKTRWGSIIHSLKSLLDTKYALKSLAVCEDTEDILNKRVSNLILDETVFWVRISKLYELINPVVEYITKLESDKPTLSEVVECYKVLKNHFSKVLPTSPLTKQEEKDFLDCLSKRQDMSLQPIHYAANILNPRYNGVHLDMNEQILGTEFIDSQVTDKYGQGPESADVMAELSQYRSKEGFYGKAYVIKTIEKVDPITWWKGTCFGSKLGSVAVDILSMPSTSAATERSFSTYGNIHSAKRNRLSVDRAGKLAFIAHNLKLLESENAKLGDMSFAPGPATEDISINNEEEDDNVCEILSTDQSGPSEDEISDMDTE